MSRYLKPAIGAIVLIALLAGSSVLYKNLSAEYKSDNFQFVGGGDSTDEDDNSVIKKDTAENSTFLQKSGNSETAVLNREEMDSQSADAGTENDSDTNVSPAPDFTVYNGEGDEVHLSDFLGKPVVLNFWATWCEPCKNEMPLFQKMYDTYGEEVEFVVVNLTDNLVETVRKAEIYIEDQGYTFPVYFDTDQDGAYNYSVRSIPVTFFIDAEGNIIAYAQGTLSEESFAQGLTLLGY